WSSDVCSSDLGAETRHDKARQLGRGLRALMPPVLAQGHLDLGRHGLYRSTIAFDEERHPEVEGPALAPRVGLHLGLSRVIHVEGVQNARVEVNQVQAQPVFIVEVPGCQTR